VKLDPFNQTSLTLATTVLDAGVPTHPPMDVLSDEDSPMKQEGSNKKKGTNGSSPSKKTEKVRGGGGMGGRRTRSNPEHDEKGATTTASTPAGNDSTNRPRNWLLRDATSAVAFQFDTSPPGGAGTLSGSKRLPCEIRVQQSADEETWPGGALWDSGVILAQLLAALPASAALAAGAAAQRKASAAKCAASRSVVTITSSPTTNATPTSASSAHRHSITVPSRLAESEVIREWLDVKSSLSRQGRPSSSAARPPLTILELGCGVGLTGMVASVSLGATLTLLTDLAVVVDKVTQPNLQRNVKVLRQHNKGGGGVVKAVPLCWGCERDEASVRQMLRQLDPEATSVDAETAVGDATVDSSHRPSKAGGPVLPSDGTNRQRAHYPTTRRRRRIPGVPDWILVGDVAYQHRPGAPSHFDALLSTLLSFTDASSSSASHGYDDEPALHSSSPIVVFATRIRMPASVDLLEMLRQHFDEIVDPPIRADEVNPDAFRDLKHNMTIHFLRRRPRTTRGEDEDAGELQQEESK
jgi:Lysine methyltransferase